MTYGLAPYGATPYGSAPEGTGGIVSSWGLSLAVAETTATPSWGLYLSVYAVVTPAWNLSLAVHDVAAMVASRAFGWSAVLTVAGVDWSGRVLGSVRVDAEAGAPAVADFTVRLPAGSFTPSSWTRAEVFIEYLWQGTVRVPIFSGWIDTITLDDARKTLAVRCVDRRQSQLLAASRDQIDVWFPGASWSPGWFDEAADNLRYAEDLLSTLQADWDVDVYGTPRLTDWKTKSSPDWTITLPESESVKWDFTRAADLIHRVDIHFKYRFTRLRLREARIKYVFDVLDSVTDKVAMPTSNLVTEAIYSAGWEVLGAPIYKRPPPYIEMPGPRFYVFDSVNGVLEATARLGRRFGQSVEENYVLDLSVSETGIDERQTQKLSGAMEAKFDVNQWEADADAEPVLPEPGLNVETTTDATTDPTYGRTGLDTALRCGLAMAARILADSHRQNEVTFSVPLNPFLSRSDTIRLNLTSREATGKVRRLVHDLDTESGRAVSTATLAISRPNLTRPATSSDHTPPAYPATQAPTQAVLDAHYMELTTIVGGKATSADFDETWSGWIVNVPSDLKVSGEVTNYGASHMSAAGHVYGDDPATAWAITTIEEPKSIFNGVVKNSAYVDAKAYPVQFRVVTPEVEDAARNNLDVALAGSYLLRLEEDSFSYTVA